MKEQTGLKEKHYKTHFKFHQATGTFFLGFSFRLCLYAHSFRTVILPVYFSINGVENSALNKNYQSQCGGTLL